VATGVGVFLALVPVSVLCASVIFVAVVALTKYVSLGSILAAATIPLFVWLFALEVELKPLLTAAVVGALLIVFAHRGNISRIFEGTEPRISDLKR
jgi:glycerol-3-phosphate acyltransferase PlsY